MNGRLSTIEGPFKWPKFITNTRAYFFVFFVIILYRFVDPKQLGLMRIDLHSRGTGFRLRWNETFKRDYVNDDLFFNNIIRLKCKILFSKNCLALFTTEAEAEKDGLLLIDLHSGKIIYKRDVAGNTLPWKVLLNDKFCIYSCEDHYVVDLDTMKEKKIPFLEDYKRALAIDGDYL